MKKFFKKIEDKWKKAVKWYKSDKNQFYQLYPSNSHEQTNQLFDQKTKQETVEHLTKDKTIENGHSSQVKYPDNIVQPQNKHDQTKQLFKQVEQTFTTNPLAAQWWVQNKKAISESLDNMYADWENQRSHKESKKYGKISRKLTSEQISEFSKLYEKVHDMNGEHSLLPEEIEQKIEDESKFEQNNDPIVKEAQKLFTANTQNAKWYLQRNLAYNEDSDNLWRLFDGKKEQYFEQEKLTKLEKQFQLSDKQIAKLENYYQKTRDLNNPTSKYGRESKFTKETINQIFQLSKQQNKEVEKSIDKSSERKINRQAYLIDKDRLHTKNDKKVLAKKAMLAKRQLER
ncbi:hypothetical protein [Lactobacillus paragasseri]|uniref:hypothetical protein n=1 Tax=Lactobacillus paragasseri TaxID=2107999 RepID=UPI0021CB6CFF|nr:hypothetical protein [Lactobacillus paragasseri]